MSFLNVGGAGWVVPEISFMKITMYLFVFIPCKIASLSVYDAWHVMQSASGHQLVLLSLIPHILQHSQVSLTLTRNKASAELLMHRVLWGKFVFYWFP